MINDAAGSVVLDARTSGPDVTLGPYANDPFKAEAGVGFSAAFGMISGDERVEATSFPLEAEAIAAY